MPWEQAVESELLGVEREGRKGAPITIPKACREKEMDVSDARGTIRQIVEKEREST